jgi:hypothetical protein
MYQSHLLFLPFTLRATQVLPSSFCAVMSLQLRKDAVGIWQSSVHILINGNAGQTPVLGALACLSHCLAVRVICVG